MWDDPGTYDGAGFDNGKFTTVGRKSNNPRGVRKPVKEATTEAELLMKLVNKRPLHERHGSGDHDHTRRPYERSTHGEGSGSRPASATGNGHASWRGVESDLRQESGRSGLGLSMDRKHNEAYNGGHSTINAVTPEQDTWTYKDPDGNVQGKRTVNIPFFAHTYQGLSPEER